MLGNDSLQNHGCLKFDKMKTTPSFFRLVFWFTILAVGTLAENNFSRDSEFQVFQKGESILSSAAFESYDIVFTKCGRNTNNTIRNQVFRFAIAQRLQSHIFQLPIKNVEMFHHHQISIWETETSRIEWNTLALHQGKNYGRTVIFVFPADFYSFSSLMNEVASLYAEELGKNFDSRLLVFFVWPENIEKVRLPAVAEKLLHPFTNLFRINTEVFVLFETKETKELILYEFYSVRNASIVQSVDVCWSSPKEDCYILTRRFFRRRNFQKGLLKVTSVDHIWDQCVTTYKRTNETLEFVGGISVLTLWGIQDALNFTIFAMESNGYIALKPDGELGGVGGQVYEGEADISITLEYLLQDRVGRITPLFPLFIDRARAFFRPPVEVRNFYSSPFTISVWFVVAGMGTLILGVVCILTMAGSGLHEKGWYSPDSVFFVTVIFSQKGWFFDPPNISGKILLLTTLGMSLICFTAYSSAIISTLTVQIIPVKSFGDLLRHGFKLMYYPDHDYLFGQQDVTGVGNISNTVFESDQIAIERALNGGFIFLTTTDIFRPLSRMFYLYERACASISSIPFDKSPLQSGFYVRRGSPIKDAFNIRLLQSIQAGLNSRYKKEQYEKEIVHCPIQPSPQHSLEMHEVHTAFFLFIAGCVCSITVYICEHIARKI